MTELWQIDAFTDRPFAGNPAGVCLPDDARAEAWMQAVAAEMNVSETAFVTPRADGGWDIRYVTPEVEVPLCGHATLASAHVLFETARAGGEIVFHAPRDVLTVRREGDWIAMDFPVRAVEPVEPPPGLLEALGARGRTFLGPDPWALVELDDAQAVRDLAPDFAKLRAGSHAAIVTAPADEPGIDFVSRFFAPPVGIDEDPVTGVAHCALAPFWAQRLGKRTLTARQVSRRGGLLRLRLGNDRVEISGQAVTVIRGEMPA
jgi:predicted PhzF superfamily epimerase YddE/YHI9